MATDIEKEMQVIANLPDKEHFINDEIFIVAHRFKTSSLDCFSKYLVDTYFIF